jgi:hypothetical protein
MSFITFGRAPPMTGWRPPETTVSLLESSAWVSLPSSAQSALAGNSRFNCEPLAIKGINVALRNLTADNRQLTAVLNLQFLCELCGNPAIPSTQNFHTSPTPHSETRTHRDVPLTSLPAFAPSNHHHLHTQLFPPLHHSYGIDRRLSAAYFYLHNKKLAPLAPPR